MLSTNHMAVHSESPGREKGENRPMELAKATPPDRGGRWHAGVDIIVFPCARWAWERGLGVPSSARRRPPVHSHRPSSACGGSRALDYTSPWFIQPRPDPAEDLGEDEISSGTGSGSRGGQ